jgi:hypothetical protein
MNCAGPFATGRSVAMDMHSMATILAADACCMGTAAS